MKVLIIGGVAAGMSTAAKLSRSNKKADITVYEKGTDLSYGACGLPYYVSDVIEDDQKLIARTKKEFEESGIRVKTLHEVIAVDTKKKTVTVKDLSGGETFEDRYDALVIATGARAIRLPVEGSNLANIHTLNTLEDGRRLKKALQQDNIETVAIIGGGFIGLEAAEMLRTMDKKTILIEQMDQVMPTYDKAITAHVEDVLKKHEVALHLGETVNHYQGDKSVSKVVTSKHAFDVDLVIETVGVRPNSAFLEKTDIKMTDNGAIIVDERMRTSAASVYAAGDVSTFYHRLKDTYEAFMPLGTHANKAGKVIAAQLSGEDKVFHGIIGSNVVKVFELELAKTGLGEKELEQSDFDHDSVMIKAPNQSGYYPGMRPVHIKIHYDKSDCRLLGCQMVGEKGVAHRINIMATAITNKMDAEGFSNLDLAYAPPFSPVWDPLQIATNQIKCQKKKRG